MAEQTTMPQAEQPRKKMSGGMIIMAVVIIIIVGTAVIYLINKTAPSQQQTPESATSQNINQPSNLGNNVTSPTAEAEAKTFNITAVPYKFSLTEIRVSKGDRVRINLTVDQGMHDWVIDEFNTRTKVLQAGQSDSIVFTADKAGSFEYYCSVDGHRQLGMVGKLIVE